MTGNPKTGSEEEKTIMLVGATGSGKSTLVDGIVNYVMGVSFEDPFRFTLVQLEEEEKKLIIRFFKYSFHDCKVCLLYYRLYRYHLSQFISRVIHALFFGSKKSTNTKIEESKKYN